MWSDSGLDSWWVGDDMASVDLMVSIRLGVDAYFGLLEDGGLSGGHRYLRTSINKGNRRLAEQAWWVITPLSPMNLVRWDEE